MTSIAREPISDNLVIIKAFSKSCKELGITRDQASSILGVDKATLSRNRSKGFDPQSKTGELCLQVIRMYRSLFAIAGGDRNFMRHWINTNNSALAGKPIELLTTIVGLVRVNEYLDAMRAKV